MKFHPPSLEAANAAIMRRMVIDSYAYDPNWNNDGEMAKALKARDRVWSEMEQERIRDQRKNAQARARREARRAREVMSP